MKTRLTWAVIALLCFGSILSLDAQATLPTLKTDLSTPFTLEPGYRSLVVPMRTADLRSPSAVERMYASAGAGGLAQFGYSTFAGPINSPVARGRTPEPYTLGPGDSLLITVWGDPVDLGELKPQVQVKVDTDGFVFLAPVGQIRVDGLSRTDVEKILSAGLARKYKRFELRLQVVASRTFPILVTGLVAQPGSVMVDAWSSLPEVLAQAGGIEKNGTLRSVKLTRANGLVISIDLYRLLLSGDQPVIRFEEGDVLWVGPIGKVAAILGKVKNPGIFEMGAGEKFGDLLRFAGGYLPSAQGTPVTVVKHIGDAWVRSVSVWDAATGLDEALTDGDLFQLDLPDTKRESESSLGIVQVTGEIAVAGFFPLRQKTTLGEILRVAGGSKPSGNLPGLVLSRASLAVQQRRQIENAIQNNNALLAIAAAKLEKSADLFLQQSLGEEISARTQAGVLLTQTLASEDLGRIRIDPAEFESFVLLDGDRIQIPRDNGVVLVLGEVYSPGALIWTEGLTLRRALELAGGFSSVASPDDVYVIKTSGYVQSVRAQGNFLGLSSLWGSRLDTGDVVFVPTKRSGDVQYWAAIKEVLGVLSTTTGIASNSFIVLKSLGLL